MIKVHYSTTTKNLHSLYLLDLNDNINTKF